MLSGIQHFLPRCRKKLVAAWRLYGAWNRLEYPARAPPMDRVLMLCVAGRFWRRGHRRSALMIVLAFHCYVRTGEFLRLRKRHVAVGRDGRRVVSLSASHSYGASPCCPQGCFAHPAVT